jgi:hypothetical protein
MNRRVVVILLSFILLIIAVLWLLESPTEQERMAAQQQKRISTLWQPEYAIRSTDPRGIGFFNELLKTHVDDSVYIVSDSDQLDSIPNRDSATYIFIGEIFGLYDYEFDSISQYIDSGSTIFLSYDHLTPNIYERYYESSVYLWDYSDKLYVAMGDTSLAYFSVFQNDTVQADWYTYNPAYIKDSLIRPFAWAMNYPIAYESDQVHGKVVMHSIPRLFCNYQVLTPNGFAHAEIMLRRIPKDKPVIWMEFGRRIADQGGQNEGNDPNSDEAKGGNQKEDDSYLQFIMRTPALRWAFLLGIIVFLLYVFFRAKRREAVLPGVPEKRNMSLAFVETLSSIYLSRNSPFSILLVLRKNFYMAINRHFYIDLLNTKNREEDVKRLVEKASVDEDELRRMLGFIETNKPERVNHVTLGELYRYIRKFYAETGIARAVSSYVEGKKEIVLNRTLWHGGPGLLVALITLIRGLYGLSRGSGYGILIVALALILIYLSIRFLSTPVARITKDTLTVYHPLFGKNSIDLTQNISYSQHPGATVFFAENGPTITIQHVWLSDSAKNALFLFIEHIKHKSA